MTPKVKKAPAAPSGSSKRKAYYTRQFEITKANKARRAKARERKASSPAAQRRAVRRLERKAEKRLQNILKLSARARRTIKRRAHKPVPTESSAS